MKARTSADDSGIWPTRGAGALFAIELDNPATDGPISRAGCGQKHRAGSQRATMLAPRNDAQGLKKIMPFATHSPSCRRSAATFTMDASRSTTNAKENCSASWLLAVEKSFFIDADWPDQRAAVIYLLIGTAKMNEFDPDTNLHTDPHRSTASMISDHGAERPALDSRPEAPHAHRRRLLSSVDSCKNEDDAPQPQGYSPLAARVTEMA